MSEEFDFERINVRVDPRLCCQRLRQPEPWSSDNSLLLCRESREVFQCKYYLILFNRKMRTG